MAIAQSLMPALASGCVSAESPGGLPHVGCGVKRFLHGPLTTRTSLLGEESRRRWPVHATSVWPVHKVTGQEGGGR